MSDVFTSCSISAAQFIYMKTKTRGRWFLPVRIRSKLMTSVWHPVSLPEVKGETGSADVFNLQLLPQKMKTGSSSSSPLDALNQIQSEFEVQISTVRTLLFGPRPTAWGALMEVRSHREEKLGLAARCRSCCCLWNLNANKGPADGGRWLVEALMMFGCSHQR